jgi:hypothetical protein
VPFRSPSKHDQKRIYPHHIIVKMQSVQNKEVILKASGENFQVNYKGKYIRITEDLAETPNT